MTWSFGGMPSGEPFWMDLLFLSHREWFGKWSSFGRVCGEVSYPPVSGVLSFSFIRK